MEHVHRADDVYVSTDTVNTARIYSDVMGAGVRPCATPAVQYAVIEQDCLFHFLEWIFDPCNTDVLKASGHDKERGRTHQLKDFISKSWQRL